MMVNRGVPYFVVYAENVCFRISKGKKKTSVVLEIMLVSAQNPTAAISAPINHLKKRTTSWETLSYFKGHVHDF